jgi:CRISPR-associated endoribonuclease Cas6
MLQTDLEAARAYEHLSRLISGAMLQDPQLKELHGQRAIKGYTLCNLYPREAEKVYKQGRVYLFNIRSLGIEFILKLKSILPYLNAGVLSTEIRNFEYRPISRLTTLTPVVATVDNKSWVKEKGLKILMERAAINSLKKYRTFIGDMTEPTENFIEGIQLLNEKPIKIPYKNNSLLGNKLVLTIKSDPISQKLAFAALGAGLLEKNAIGMGYCKSE